MDMMDILFAQQTSEGGGGKSSGSGSHVGILDIVKVENSVSQTEMIVEVVPEHPKLHAYDFTQSLEDIGLVRADAELLGGATRDSSGVHFNGLNQRLKLFEDFSAINTTIEIAFGALSFAGTGSSSIYAISLNSTGSAELMLPLEWVAGTGWKAIGVNSQGRPTYPSESTLNISFSTLQNSTLKIVFDANGGADYYLNDLLVGSFKSVSFSYGNYKSLYVGGLRGENENNQFYNCTIKSIKYYTNN